MRRNGIHHVTAISGSTHRNLDFYTRTLGRQVVRIAKYGELWLVVADKALGTARPEGAASAQKEYRLQDGGLTCPVLAGNQIELRRKLELR